MNDIIATGDDDDDLRRNDETNGFKRVFALVILVAVAFSTVMLQQHQGSMRFGIAVAHAATDSDPARLCAFKKDFAKSLDKDGDRPPVSLAEGDPCFVAKELPKETDVSQLEWDISEIVAAYPLSSMAHSISQQDASVAAFLVGIAKKESDWGNHAPSIGGQDCYNYWGYKGAGQRGTTAGGYACFASPEEAVQTVGNRLSVLVNAQHRDTPAKMLVWKCGSSCEGHSPESVASWIGTVNTYYQKIAANNRG